METRILIFLDQTTSSQAASAISANMGLPNGSTFVYAIPAALVDGRWYLPYPTNSAWLAEVSGFTVASGTGLAAVGEAGVPSVPASITNYQARAQLYAMPSVTPSPPAGRTLLDDVDAAVASMGGLADQAWEYANYLYRASPLVDSLATQLGMTSAQMDAFFVAASALSA